MKQPGCNYCEHPEDYTPGEFMRHTHRTLRCTAQGAKQFASLSSPIFTYAVSKDVREIIDLVLKLDDYEGTIVLAYIKRLKRTREPEEPKKHVGFPRGD